MKKKYEINWFTFFDKSGIEKHLEEMASKGWLLEKAGMYLWRYRKIQQQNIRFAVTYFPKGDLLASAQDYDDEQGMWDFCRYGR